MSEIPNPKSTRNLTPENVRHLLEMKIFIVKRKKVIQSLEILGEINLKNMPAEVNSHVNGSQSKNNKQNTKEVSYEDFRSIKTVTENISSYSSSVGHVTKIGMAQMEHMRAKTLYQTELCQKDTQIMMRF
jgi:hypothetical protein